MDNLESLSRKEVQCLCKERGIRANLTTKAMINLLRDYNLNSEIENQSKMIKAVTTDETREPLVPVNMNSNNNEVKGDRKKRGTDVKETIVPPAGAKFFSARVTSATSSSLTLSGAFASLGLAEGSMIYFCKPTQEACNQKDESSMENSSFFDANSSMGENMPASGRGGQSTQDEVDFFLGGEEEEEEERARSPPVAAAQAKALGAKELECTPEDTSPVEKGPGATDDDDEEEEEDFEMFATDEEDEVLGEDELLAAEMEAARLAAQQEAAAAASPPAKDEDEDALAQEIQRLQQVQRDRAAERSRALAALRRAEENLAQVEPAKAPPVVAAAAAPLQPTKAAPAPAAAPTLPPPAPTAAPTPAAAAAAPLTKRGDRIARIHVCVRKRPLLPKEVAIGVKDIIDCPSPNELILMEPKVRVDLTKYVDRHSFAFDAVVGENSSNEEVYNRTARSLVPFIFRSQGKATCFAYGQTGSGKTHTMMGVNDDGLYGMAARDIMAMVAQPEYAAYGVYVTFFEIYTGALYDLLNDRKLLHAREDAGKNVRIMGIHEKRVATIEEFFEVLHLGNATRSVGSTGANDDSSRSHAILQITLKERGKVERGRLSFIDLAGSERAKDTLDNVKDRRREGAGINKSLLALKECIRALSQRKGHLPFRGSKLTQVLKDSFIGNSRTVMIANISPSAAASENTLNTLRYADRVKELRGGKARADAKPGARRQSTAAPLRPPSRRGAPSGGDRPAAAPMPPRTSGAAANGKFGWVQQPKGAGSNTSPDWRGGDTDDFQLFDVRESVECMLKELRAE